MGPDPSWGGMTPPGRAAQLGGPDTVDVGIELGRSAGEGREHT